MEAVLDQNFSARYQSATESIYDELKSRLNGVTLESMKAFLREKNISFDESSDDLKEFKKNIVSKLDVSVKKELTTIEENLSKDLSEVTDALHAGSQTAFSKFAEKAGILGKSSLKAMARITATKTAYALGGPVFGTAVNAGAVIVPAVMKCVKDVRKFSQDTKDAAIDTVLLKLTTGKDSDGKLTCQIPQQIREDISSVFAEEGIKINNTNPVLFFKDIMQLDNSQKDRIANMINDGLGKKLDIENEKKQVEVNLKQMSKQLKKEITSTVSTAALLGMNVGTTLSQWDAATSASIMTGLTTGAISGKGWVGLTVGGGQWIASKFGGLIPGIGDIIEDSLEKVNTQLVLGGSIGVAVGGALLFKTGKMAYKAAVGTLKRMQHMKKVRENKEDMDKKIETALEETQEAIDNKSNKDVMMEIVIDTLKSKGIQIDGKIHTITQLKEYVNGLDADSKAEVAEITGVLEKVGRENESNAKKALKGIAKTAYWGGIIALAGLGAYDELINPGFLDALSEKNEIIQEAEELGITTDELIDHKVEVAYTDASSQVNEFKAYLPQDDYNYLSVEKFPLDLNGIREIEAAEIRPMLEQLKLVNSNGIVNTSVLKDVLNNADPELLDLVKESFGMDTVDEIANSLQAQEYFRRIGLYPFPEGQDELFDSIFGTNYNPFGSVLNEYFSKALENIPTQGSTNEEIMEFMNSLSKDEVKADAFKTFVLQNGKNTGDLAVAWDEVKAIFTTTGREEALEEVTTKIETYTEMEATKEGTKAAVKTKLPTEPIRIAGLGAAIGAGITAVVNFGRKFINGEFFGKKPKALPPGDENKAIENDNTFNTRIHTTTPTINELGNKSQDDKKTQVKDFEK